MAEFDLDVFLSHNGNDKPLVRKLKHLLTKAGLKAWLPVDTPFFKALSTLAFHIQDNSGSNERWGKLSWNAARDAMQQALKGRLPADTILEAGCDLGLFEDDAAQADIIRFIHQQMQEYFAAWVLAEQADLARLAVPWPSADLVESTEALLAQGVMTPYKSCLVPVGRNRP